MKHSPSRLLSAGVVVAALTFDVSNASAQSAARSAPTQTASSQHAGAGRVMARTSAMGALAGTVMAMGYYFLSEKGERSSGCQPLNCALPFLSASGAIAGLFIGRELDSQRKAFAPRAGEAMSYGISEGATLAPPTYIDVRDSLIAVVSDSGAQLIMATPSPRALRRRANGLSSMRQVAIMPSRGTLLLGTGTALWETNLVSGPASRVADGAVDALAVSNDAVMSGSGHRLRIKVGTGDAARIDSMEFTQNISAITYDESAKSWWVATDSQVVRVSSEGGKLTRSNVALSTPATARAIAINNEWIAAALGDEGVIAWRRESVGTATPTIVRVAQEPRFAYDLAFLGDALYVAGGVDGLFQLSLNPTGRVVGSSRQLQFATTVRAANGVLWVGDRNRQSVVRVTP